MGLKEGQSELEWETEKKDNLIFPSDLFISTIEGVGDNFPLNKYIFTLFTYFVFIIKVLLVTFLLKENLIGTYSHDFLLLIIIKV